MLLETGLSEVKKMDNELRIDLPNDTYVRVAKYDIPTIDLNTTNEINLVHWFENYYNNLTLYYLDATQYHIQFMEDKKQIIINDVTFDIIEGTHYVMKPNSKRYKVRTIKTVSFQYLKRYLVEAMYEDLFVDSVFSVLSDYV